MGEEFLACPRLTGEQDRQVTERTDTKNRLKNSRDCLALPNSPQLPHHAFDSRLIVLSLCLDLEKLRKVALQILTKLSPGAVEEQ